MIKTCITKYHYNIANFSSAAPKIQGSTNDILTVEHGHDVTLPCKTSGYPSADKTWSPGVDPTQHARYVQTPEGLEITNAQYLDTRMFTCTASNIFGTQEKHVYLVVIGIAYDVIMMVSFCCGFYL